MMPVSIQDLSEISFRVILRLYKPDQKNFSYFPPDILYLMNSLTPVLLSLFTYSVNEKKMIWLYFHICMNHILLEKVFEKIGPNLLTWCSRGEMGQCSDVLLQVPVSRAARNLLGGSCPQSCCDHRFLDAMVTWNKDYVVFVWQCWAFLAKYGLKHTIRFKKEREQQEWIRFLRGHLLTLHYLPAGALG